MSQPTTPGVVCDHLATVVETPDLIGAQPSGDGCVECLLTGARWVHLRRCLSCGHVGCCDNSPNRHTTAHFREAGHPLVQSFEPGEDWLWCYVDDVVLEVEEFADSPSHP